MLADSGLQDHGEAGSEIARVMCSRIAGSTAYACLHLTMLEQQHPRSSLASVPSGRCNLLFSKRSGSGKQHACSVQLLSKHMRLSRAFGPTAMNQLVNAYTNLCVSSGTPSPPPSLSPPPPTPTKPQVDEPALREGLPLKKSKWEAYLGWAVDAFR
jgi:hypothetical protein